jgi:hypothetical protein
MEAPKFFYLENKGGLYWLTLKGSDDPSVNLPMGVDVGQSDNAVAFHGADAALKAVRLYNRRNQCQYMIKINP